MKNGMTRRGFLRATTLGLGAIALAPRSFAANDRLCHACIGVTGMGAVDLENFQSHPGTQIVAICDVDRARLDIAAKKLPDARRYTDWRELLAKEGDKIDSVNVTVPDHMHASIAMSAMRAGKHVYLQKPMCHDVAEVRALCEEVRRAGVVTQLGTQHASDLGDRMAVRYLREGVIGKLKHAYVASNRKKAVALRLAGPRPEKGAPPPPGLAWDLWLGSAPARDFAPGVYHPAVWRAWQDFGTGWSGDIGCHLFSALWLGIQPAAPRTVVAEVQDSWKNDPARFGEMWPQSNHITWVFPGNERTAGDFVVEWFDGEFYPPKEIQALYPYQDSEYPEEGAMFIGTEGAMLLPHKSGPILLPREKFASVKRPDLEPRNHYHHFLDACLGGEPTEARFAQAGPMTEAILLGTVAIRVPGKTLEWDAARMTIPNEPKANRFLRRAYRDGWQVAGLCA